MWIKWAKKAGYNFVWAPLDPSIKFDVDKANKFIDSVIGVDYGYEVLLTSWIDMLENYPCRRNSEDFREEDHGICIDPHFIEVLFTFLDRYSKDASRIWTQAMGQRVGKRDAPLWEIYKTAHEQGIESHELPYLPE